MSEEPKCDYFIHDESTPSFREGLTSFHQCDKLAEYTIVYFMKDAYYPETNYRCREHYEDTMISGKFKELRGIVSKDRWSLADGDCRGGEGEGNIAYCLIRRIKTKT